MIKDAEEKNILKKDKSIIIEPTSGNTGIALTGIASNLGYKVEIVIPEKVSEETKNILRKLGATLHETSDDLCPRVGAGTDQSIALAYAISKPRPDTYYMPNQYENDANFLSHYQSTGPEIWEQTQGKVTHFFTGCGTGGYNYWYRYIFERKKRKCPGYCHSSSEKSLATRLEKFRRVIKTRSFYTQRKNSG